jgi:non-ribosomal peptide synthase protein (TIGR01720 family)
LGYGLFKYCGTPEQRQALACLPKAEVVFNYLGQFDTSFDEKALWILADEPLGDLTDKAAPSSHSVSINAHVYENELRINISYGEERRHEAAIKAFG